MLYMNLLRFQEILFPAYLVLTIMNTCMFFLFYFILLLEKKGIAFMLRGNLTNG